MNDESLLKSLAMQDRYVRTSTGLFVAWSLATPPHVFGDWSLLSIEHGVKQGLVKPTVQFVRSLEEQEIERMYDQPFMWWGMKLTDEPWVLVQCRPHLDKSYRHPRAGRKHTDSIKNTGV